MRFRPIFSSHVPTILVAVALVVGSPLIAAEAGPRPVKHPATAKQSAHAKAQARAKAKHAARAKATARRKHTARVKHRGGMLAPIVTTTTGAPPAATAPTNPGSTGTPFDISAAATTNDLDVGITHSQLTANAWDPAPAVAEAKQTITQVGYQNEMLMGWGPLSPEPSPGVYDFGGLDAWMRLIRSTGGTPVLTLTGAPDWMKGGQAGHTDWSQLGVAPLPQYYGAFAELAVTVAKRYPDVQRFQVWSELRGFWNASEKRWDYEDYTNLYNTVYDALKAYNPALQVGGPYVVFDSYVGPPSNPSPYSGSWGNLDQRPFDVVSYWLAHMHGADFIAVDGGTGSKNAILDQVNPFAGVEKLVDVNNWLTAHTSLPIWWSELYPCNPNMSVGSAGCPAATAYALMAVAQSGASAALLWQEPHRGGSCVGPCLWTNTQTATGGDRTPTGTAVIQVRDLLASGAPIRTVTGLPWGVVGFAVGDKVMLINTTPGAASVVTPNGIVGLAPYGIAVVPAT